MTNEEFNQSMANKNIDKTHDIAGYVASKLYLVNKLTGSNYQKLHHAKSGISKEMAGIIDRLSHSQLDYLIERIEAIS